MFFYIKAMRSWKSIICMTVGSNDKHWQSCMLSILITVPAMFSSHVLCPDCINENIQTFAAFFSYKILLIMNGTKSFLDKYNPKFLNHQFFDKKKPFLYLILTIYSSVIKIQSQREFSVVKATLELALSICSFVRPSVTLVYQESSRWTLIIYQLYSSIDFNHHSSFQL